MPDACLDLTTSLRSPSTRRHALCCGGAALAAGLFSSLLPAAAQADERPARWRNPCRPGLPEDAATAELLARTFEGLDPAQLWDTHCHLLGTGDAGSGCQVDVRMSQWWHPVEVLRRQAVLNGACVAPQAASVDRAYVARLQQLVAAFPPGARWLLFAFDQAHDEQGRARPEWTTFHTPDGHAASVAAQDPARWAWVASIHPYREDALERLAQALAQGAVALKWLPSAMGIDLSAARLRPFYERLAAARLPLIVHCGEERAVPGAQRPELGNPLQVRAPLEAGVRVVVAHAASLGTALDLDQKRPRLVPAFDLWARLMDQPAWRTQLLADVSALFQTNRTPQVWQAVLHRQDWHERLLHGSDYPLPGVLPTVRLQVLVAQGVLAPADVVPLARLREHNPLLFNLALQRAVRWRGRALRPEVFATGRHFRR